VIVIKEKEKIVKRKLLLTTCFLAIASAALFAQSNALMDQLLEEQRATYGKSVLIALSAANTVPVTATIEAAVAKVEENAWLSGKKAEDPITLGELSFVLMRAFGLSGGVMYAAFPGPRYACREFEFRGYILRNPTPDRFLSGEEALQIIAKVLAGQEVK